MKRKGGELVKKDMVMEKQQGAIKIRKKLGRMPNIEK